MLYKTLLLLHLFGLTIGAGTGFYLAAVGRHATHNLEQAEARTLVPGINGAISKVGSIGLALLLISGLGLAMIMGPAAFTTWFWIKMALVIAIVLFVGVMHMLAARSRRAGDANSVSLMKTLSPIGPVLAVSTLVATVLAFR